jgi:branched-chain amino acid aminotransferase
MSTVKADLNWKELPFGYVKTDFNVRYYYKDGTWSGGDVVSDENITINMAAPCLHYGQQAFEGLKAFETNDGRIVCFRPDENARRMNTSADRIKMPRVPENIFINAVMKAIDANRRFVPPYGTGASLYIRPLLIGVGPKVGLGPAPEYMLVVFVTPVGPYYKGGFKPVKALVLEQFDRAAPDGVGDCKVGGNYAAGLPGGEYGHEKGFPIVLYLDSKEKRYIDEFGTSNFIGIKNNTYMTPTSKSILPSITNKSLAVLAGDIGLGVEKRPIEINEVKDFSEIGAVGTAAVLTPVSALHYKGNDILIGNQSHAGPVLTRLYDLYTKIQTGEAPDTYNWLYEVK